LWQKLIMKYRRVLIHTDQMRSHRWHLSDQHPPQRIGKTHITVV
jgi:hypothetical protein